MLHKKIKIYIYLFLFVSFLIFSVLTDNKQDFTWQTQHLQIHLSPQLMMRAWLIYELQAWIIKKSLMWHIRLLAESADKEKISHPNEFCRNPSPFDHQLGRSILWTNSFYRVSLAPSSAFNNFLSSDRWGWWEWWIFVVSHLIIIQTQVWKTNTGAW